MIHQPHPKLVSIKVPRTGSESFGKILEYLYTTVELMDFVRGMKFNPKIYDPESWFYKDDDPSAPFQKELEGFVVYNMDIQYVHNHVPVTFFSGLWTDAPRVAFLREPVSWIISCYWYAKALGHIPGPMGIWEYVELDYRKNWMTMLVQHIDYFDFIGFQETWKRSVEDFIDRFTHHSSVEFWNKTIPTLNVQKDMAYIRFAKDMSQDKMFIRRCKKLHKEDFKLYQAAYKEFGNE
jgi:hypothetical protein